MKLHDIFDKIAKIIPSKILFYIFLFFLPITTGKVFFTEKSFFFGYHAFYNSIEIFFIDLLFLTFFLAWLIESRGKFSVKKDEINLSLGIFWLILASSLLFSREIYLGLYGLVRISEYIVVFLYIREKIVFSREKFIFFSLILASFTLQSVLAIGQYLNQSSFGLSLLGEEFLRPGLPGMAEFVSEGLINPFFSRYTAYLSPISDILLRGYGTLPHPNVLSGLLFTGLMANIYVLYFSREKWVKTTIFCLSLLTLTAGLSVTFSRVSWAVAALAIAAWLILIFVKIRKPYILGTRTGQSERFSEKYDPRQLATVVGALTLTILINLLIFGPAIKSRLLDKGQETTFSQQESIVNRGRYDEIGIKIIKQHPFLGIGLRNFVARMDEFVPTGSGRLLPYMHQPAHNIYLLIAAEGGLLALLAFLVVICNIVRRAPGDDQILRYTLLITLAGLLVIGLFDHYLWTIPQASMILWIILGLVSASGQNKNGPSAIP